MKTYYLILTFGLFLNSCDNTNIVAVNINLELYEMHKKVIYKKEENSLEFDINLVMKGENPNITLSNDSLLYTIQIHQNNNTNISISQYFGNIVLNNYSTNIVIDHNGIPIDGYLENEAKICDQLFSDLYSQYSSAGTTSFASIHYTEAEGVVAFADNENTIWLLDGYK